MKNNVNFMITICFDQKNKPDANIQTQSAFEEKVEYGKIRSNQDQKSLSSYHSMPEIVEMLSKDQTFLKPESFLMLEWEGEMHIFANVALFIARQDDGKIAISSTPFKQKGLLGTTQCNGKHIIAVNNCVHAMH